MKTARSGLEFDFRCARMWGAPTIGCHVFPSVSAIETQWTRGPPGFGHVDDELLRLPRHPGLHHWHSLLFVALSYCGWNQSSTGGTNGSDLHLFLTIPL